MTSNGISDRTTTYFRRFTYNCDLFVLGPELAILNIPRPVCVRLGLNSSANGDFQYDSPPSPVPVGSPPCTWN